MDSVRNPVGPSIPLLTAPSLSVLTMDMLPLETSALPEMEKFTVELKKDLHGLGITIAGYVCEKGKHFCLPIFYAESFWILISSAIALKICLAENIIYKSFLLLFYEQFSSELATKILKMN